MYTLSLKQLRRGGLMALFASCMWGFLTTEAAAVNYSQSKSNTFVRKARKPLLNWRVSLRIDNDAFLSQTDRGYTQGLQLKVTWSKWILPELLTKALFGPENVKYLTSACGLLLPGHNIYTPEDHHEPSVILDDRPYAGWLYFGMEYEVRHEDWYFTVQVLLGWVGPPALAAPIQTGFHRFIQILGAEAIDVEGWGNQLPFEFIVQTSFDYFHELAAFGRIDSGAEEHRRLDFFINPKVELGTALTRIALGLVARLGFITKRFASNTSLTKHTKRRWDLPSGDLYIYMRTHVIFAFHNTFITGSLWGQSHGVPLQHFVFEGEFGVYMRFGAFFLRFGGVYRSREGVYINAPPVGHRFLRLLVGAEG